MRRVAAVGFIAWSAIVAGCRPEPIVLGMAAGTHGSRAAFMALEDARARGLDIPLDSVFIPEVDNQAAPAVRTADSLASLPGMVAVMGHSNSAASLTAAPIYNQAHIVQIAPNSTADLYSQAGPYSFRMVPPDSEQGRVIAEFVAREFAGARVAMVYVNDDYGRGLRESVLASLPAGAVEIVTQEPHVMQATPEMIRRTILGVVDAHPDVILWLSRYYQLLSYLRGFRERLGPVPIVGGDGLSPIENVSDPDGLFPPMYYIRLVDLDARPETRRFRERFRERFHEDPADAAALAYDAYSMLLEGVAEGARTGEEMRRYLVSLGRDRPPFDGITGPVQFDDKGDVARAYVMGHITGESGEGGR